MKDEAADIEIYRKEMITLISKKNQRKGTQPAMRAMPAHTVAPQHETRVEVSTANEGRLDVAAVPDRNRMPENISARKVKIEIHGQTKDIDLTACLNLDSFHKALECKFGPQAKPEVRNL